jgi:mono/diheme cytochrome c family protein
MRTVSRKELGLLAISLTALVFGVSAISYVTLRPSSASASLGLGDQRFEGGGSAAGATVPAMPKQGNARAGKKVFVTAGCGSCHTLAAAGASATAGTNLDTVKLTYAEAFNWVSAGQGAMPSFGGRLSVKELADAAAFLAKSVASGTSATASASEDATAAGKAPPRPKNGNPLAGKEVFVRAGCGSCHALAAAGANGMVGANLDQVELTYADIFDAVSYGKGSSHSFMGTLSVKELADVAVFLERFQGGAS